MRRKAKIIDIGNIKIGGNFPIAIQSMLNIPLKKIGDKITQDSIKKNIKQAIQLQNSGCQILRIAIPHYEAVKIIYELKKHISIPIVSDIHFDYKLAIESVNAGADKIRINPGNIGNADNVKAIANICNQKNIPIRIGVNSGSVEKNILTKYGRPTPQAMCESAIYNIKLLEKFDFNKIVVSIKSSDVKSSYDAYKLIAAKCEYPLHIGITETGTASLGTIKSAIGIGALLLNGIGDTIRVSLTDSPIQEVECAIKILKSLNLYSGVNIISCPTCGRTKTNLIKLVQDAEKLLSKYKVKMNVAIMGCEVNGPGEAREADIGICAGDGFGMIFKKGQIFKKVKEEDMLNELIIEIDNMCKKEG